MVRRLREAGAIVVGLTRLPGDGDLRLHRVGDPGRHPQPLESAADPGRLQRRLGRGSRRRHRRARLGRRRRRLDPHPGRLLRALRPQALAAAGSRWRRRTKAGTASPCSARSAATSSTPRSGSTSPPAAPPSPRRRRRPSRPFVEAAQTPPGKLRVAWSTAAPARRGAPDRLRRRQAGRRRRRRAARARSATTSPSSDPAWGSIGNNITPRFLRGVSDTVDSVEFPERLERRTRGFGRLGRQLPDAIYERAMRGRAVDIARVNALFDDHRRPRHPGDGRNRAADPPLGGTGRAAHRARDEPLLSLLRSLEPPRQPGDGGSLRLRRRRHAALGPGRSGGPATRRRCSRSPARSRPSAPGPTRSPRRSPRA